MEQFIPQTPISESKTSPRWAQFHGFFPLTLIPAIIVGCIRYFSLEHPIVFALSVLGLIAGVLLAHLLFAEETRIRSALAQALHDPELTQMHGSLLRNGMILILLPILSFFALSSTRQPVGLGFIWGVMAIYSYDLFLFALHKNAEFAEEYFHAFDVEARVQHVVAIAFILFTVLFGVLLVATRYMAL